MTQYTIAQVQALRIRYSTLQPQYQFYWCTLSHSQSYWYYIVQYCPSTSLTDMIQFTSASPMIWVNFCRSTSPTDMKQSTTAQYQSYWYDSPLLTRYESYWYNTIHYCPNTSHIDKIVHYCPIPVLLIPYWYQSYWYSAVHYCPNSSPIDTLQSTTDPVQFLLIRHNTLLPQYQSYLKATVHFCPSTNINTSKSTSAPVPVILIPYSLLLTQ